MEFLIAIFEAREIRNGGKVEIRKNFLKYQKKKKKKLR